MAELSEVKNYMKRAKHAAQDRAKWTVKWTFKNARSWNP